MPIEFWGGSRRPQNPKKGGSETSLAPGEDFADATAKSVRPAEQLTPVKEQEYRDAMTIAINALTDALRIIADQDFSIYKKKDRSNSGLYYGGGIETLSCRNLLLSGLITELWIDLTILHDQLNRHRSFADLSKAAISLLRKLYNPAFGSSTITDQEVLECWVKIGQEINELRAAKSENPEAVFQAFFRPIIDRS